MGTGGAYAANTIGSSDVIDESLLSQDIKNGTINGDDLATSSIGTAKIKDGKVATIDLADAAVDSAKIADGSVTSAKVLDDTTGGGGLGSQDLAANAVSGSEIATDAVGALEVQNDSIDSGEIVDFGLSNQDIGVLFAEVQSDGTLDTSSGGGVTATKVGTGTYEVDFGRTVTSCTAVATIGPSGAGSADGQVNVADRSGNAQAVFVDTNTAAGAAADKPFRLVVVC